MRASTIGGRIGRLTEIFGRGDCPTCREWRETRVHIGTAAELPAPPPPPPARCPACGGAVPRMTNIVRIIAPDPEEAG
jgi:hypothetical protein